MQEKTMVNDVLSMVKSSKATYAQVIFGMRKPTLRSRLQQIRNDCETSQYELYKLAQTKGFYKPASAAPDNEVSSKDTVTSSWQMRHMR
jgi:spore coat protein CotF